RISERNIRAALAEVEKQRTLLHHSRPQTASARILSLELDLGARMGAQSCQIMLWQQSLAAGNSSRARQLAGTGVREFRKLDRDFRACWPLRNKGTTEKCSPFLQWRIQDYRRGVLHFSPETARTAQ